MIERMVESYSKLDTTVIQNIKEQQNMRFVANTITEHYEHIGELRGEQRGELRGELRAMVEQLRQYETLLSEKMLSKRAFDRLVKPLKAKIAAVQAELQALDAKPHAQSA